MNMSSSHTTVFRDTPFLITYQPKEIGLIDNKAVFILKYKFYSILLAKPPTFCTLKININRTVTDLGNSWCAYDEKCICRSYLRWWLDIKTISRSRDVGSLHYMQISDLRKIAWSHGSLVPCLPGPPYWSRKPSMTLKNMKTQSLKSFMLL